MLDKMKPPPGSLPINGHYAREGLVLDLPLNIKGTDGVGIVKEYSLYGNHGTNRGLEWVDEPDGPALKFDSDVSKSIFIPSTQSLDLRFGLSNGFTIIMDITIGNPSTWVTYISKSTANYQGGEGFGVIHNIGTNELRFYIDVDYTPATVPASPGERFTITFTYSSDEIKRIYKNGELLATHDDGPKSINLSPDIYIGVTEDGVFPFDGTISTTLIYNRELSEQELLEQFNNPWQAWEKGLSPAALVAAQGGAVGNPWYYYMQQRIGA